MGLLVWLVANPDSAITVRRMQLQGNPTNTASTGLRVGFDWDGIFGNFPANLGDWLAMSTGRPRTDFPDVKSEWDFMTLEWGLTLEEFFDAYAAGVLAKVILWEMPPYPGAIEAMHAIVGDGHEIHIVTDRSPRGAVAEAHEASRHWLAKHAVPHHSLTFSADKTVVPVDVFIEDRPKNHDAINDAGGLCVLHTRNWNVTHPAKHRVNDLWEFREFVNELAASRDAVSA